MAFQGSILMNFRHYSLLIGAASALLALSACNQTEPASPNADPVAAPKTESLRESVMGEGRAMTQAEVAEYLASKKAGPEAAEQLQSAPAAPLAKSAALPVCLVDFNQTTALAALINQAASTFVTGPWYTHSCYNNANYWFRFTPLNENHYHLVSENPKQCYYNATQWGTTVNGKCTSPSDAKYWARSAMNMNGNSGFTVVAAANGYYRPFNLNAFYVRSGTVKVIANRVGIGWWVWYGNTAGQRWYWPANNSVYEAQFYDNAGNGVFNIDNIEAQII
jgi:hypothetical protein